MAYQTEKFRGTLNAKAKDWMRLSKALSHIQESEGCDIEGAIGQIKLALGDGALDARWRLFPISSFDTELGRAPHLSNEPVPSNHGFWARVEITKGGIVRIPEDKEDRWWSQPAFAPNAGDLRRYVLELSDKDPDKSALKKMREKLFAPRKRKLFVLHPRVMEIWPSTGRAPVMSPNASIAQITEVARQIYANPGRGPNLAEAEQAIRRLLPGATREPIRQVLDEAEFSSLRQGIGRPRSKNFYASTRNQS